MKITIASARHDCCSDAIVISRHNDALTLATRATKVVSVYCLVMRVGSDNFHSFSMGGILKRIKAKRAEIIVDKPVLAEGESSHSREVYDFVELKSQAAAIVANRITGGICDEADNVFSRDLSEQG